MSPKLESHLNWNVNKVIIPLKLACRSNWNVSQIRMLLKLECHLNLNVTQKRVSLKLECHSNCNFTQIGTFLKLEHHSNLNVTQSGMSLDLKCHWNWNVTQTGMSLKLECYSNSNVKCLRFQDWVNFTLIPCLPSDSLNIIEKKMLGSLSNNLLCKCIAPRFCIHWKIAKQWPNDIQFCCLKKTYTGLPSVQHYLKFKQKNIQQKF